MIIPVISSQDYQIQLSIIIPVYNVEEYVGKCIRSCAEQDISSQEYEIIVINDGSPDGSLSICERLALEHNHIRIISQKNKGLSGARNTGLLEAKGEYVWFVDSDDWISPSVLANICKQLTGSLDILWLGHDVVKDHVIISSYIPVHMKENCSGQIFYCDYVRSENYIWKFIYRRKFLIEENLSFYEGILYEDFEFTPRALAVAQKCLTIPFVAYNYLVRNDSIVGCVKKKHIEDRIWICKQHLNFSENTGLGENFRLCLKDKVNSMVISCAEMISRNNIQFPETYKDILKAIRLKDSETKINQLKVSLLKFNFHGYVFLYKIMVRLFR